MEYQQPPHTYMHPPPPPPPPSDPNHQHQQQPSLVPPPPRPTWFSGQFQYTGQSPSPANHQQWAPPAPQSHASYPAPPPQPYHAHHQYHPPPPPPPPRPQSYPPQLNQEWHNSGWNQNQNQQLQYPAHNNGEDWAAKARAWAASQTSSDNQYPQSQYASFGRIEENQYLMANPQNSDGQHFPVATSSYQQHQASVPPPYQSSESSFSSGYVPDGPLPFNGRNGSLVGEPNSALPHQESSSSLSVHQQEVPSSYSSVTGKENIADQSEQFYKSPWAFTSTSQHQAQPAPDGRALSIEQPQYAFSHQSDGRPSDLSDQPLDFAPGYNRDHAQHVQSNYSLNSGAPLRGIESPSDIASIHAWSASAAPGVVYPPVHLTGPQVDPSLAISSPVSGNFGPLFGRVSGQNFQPIGPSVSVPFGGAGTFSGDGFGASGVSDRVKKPSVPSWLREQILKKKAIATSAPEFSEHHNSMAEEVIDKSISGDPDSKSVDSSRSTEEEDDEEDDGEIARTAAINQEIKRVLTEILLKVTDDLFNEIATKVLSEEVDSSDASLNREASPSAPEIPTLKASAKVLITARPSATESDDSRISILSAPGDLLGLASYASDDDEDYEIKNTDLPNSKRIHQVSTTKKLSDDLSVGGNDLSAAEAKENLINNFVSETDGRMYPNGSSGNYRPNNELNSNGSGRESSHGTLRSKNSSKTDLSPDDGVEVVNKADISMSKDNIKGLVKTELSVGSKKVTSGLTEVREDRKKMDDKRQSSEGKYIARGDESRRRQDERKVKKEKTDDYDELNEKLKEHPDSKGRSGHRNDKDMQTEKDRRTRGKEGNERKRDGTRDEKGERTRDKPTSDSSRHKRYRSPSVDSRGRDSKNHTVVGRTNNYSDDESSEESRRKLRSRKRKLSPSPDRSHRRQVSRSPHSKHSQRRHSPYSSLDTTRGKRSRSKSPARRKR
ncbi:putative PNN-interacting serine/arginine-rich protein [Heracleum sosnowskyi]|uniref:PNN-interacting serine/arginine-rich protein n=1 Tax=Heracleum sosnowskyi TaxID=360622 RepID=A0AAD8JEU6_9APIA|nr:putative PNN-interacting serine/arginine-rich protein [Heracleum sosnowskyi]